jgi:hypothetical protein
MTRTKRALAFAAIFWAAALGLLTIDWATSSPHNRFEEPPPWQLGQERVEGAGHCAAPLK